jgi:hypothetical protein
MTLNWNLLKQILVTSVGCKWDGCKSGSGCTSLCSVVPCMYPMLPVAFETSWNLTLQEFTLAIIWLITTVLVIKKPKHLCATAEIDPILREFCTLEMWHSASARSVVMPSQYTKLLEYYWAENQCFHNWLCLYNFQFASQVLQLNFHDILLYLLLWNLNT